MGHITCVLPSSVGHPRWNHWGYWGHQRSWCSAVRIAVLLSNSWTKSHGDEGKCRVPRESLWFHNRTEPRRAPQGPRIAPCPADARSSSPYRRRPGCLLSSQLPSPTLSCSQHGLFVQLDPPTREQADNGSPVAAKSLVPALPLCPRACSGHGHRLCLKVRAAHLQSWMV